MAQKDFLDRRSNAILEIPSNLREFPGIQAGGLAAARQIFLPLQAREIPWMHRLHLEFMVTWIHPTKCSLLGFNIQ
jgi:hypothetical protein